MAARRRKAYFSDIATQCIGFSAFQRITDSHGNKGTRYVLTEPLTKEKQAYFTKFENVRFGKAQYRYAPEIVHDTLILLDKIPTNEA